MLALAGAAAALSCRSESSTERAPGPAATEFFPLVKGARWTYKLDLLVTSTEIEVLAKGDTQVEGLGRLAFVMDERNLGQALGMAPVGPTGPWGPVGPRSPPGVTAAPLVMVVDSAALPG